MPVCFPFDRKVSAEFLFLFWSSCIHTYLGAFQPWYKISNAKIRIPVQLKVCMDWEMLWNKLAAPILGMLCTMVAIWKLELEGAQLESTFFYNGSWSLACRSDSLTPSIRLPNHGVCLQLNMKIFYFYFEVPTLKSVLLSRHCRPHMNSSSQLGSPMTAVCNHVQFWSLTVGCALTSLPREQVKCTAGHSCFWTKGEHQPSFFCL